MLEGTIKRLKLERDSRIHAAWLTARLTRADKIPDLEALIGEQPQTQNWQQIYETMRGWAAAQDALYAKGA
jgi:hypothetical protein